MSIENFEMIETRLSKIENMLIGTKNVLTFEEVALFTGLSKSYLYKLTSSGKIPHFKPHGKLVYFERESITSWLLQNPIKTAQQIEIEAATYVVTGKKEGGVK